MDDIFRNTILIQIANYVISDAITIFVVFKVKLTFIPLMINPFQTIIFKTNWLSGYLILLFVIFATFAYCVFGAAVESAVNSNIIDLINNIHDYYQLNFPE